MLWANRNGVYYVLDRANGRFLTGKPFTKAASRTPGSPALPSVGFIVASGLTLSLPAAPQDASIWGHSSPGWVSCPVPGSQATAYGVGGPEIELTMS